jgi:hypothetical protein
VCATMLAACDNEGGTAQAITKEEARAMGGRSASGEDICLVEGWYGDAECDDFCVEPDADCADAGRDASTSMIDAGTTTITDAGIPDGCRPESDLAFCLRMEQWCQPVSGMDNCGRPRSVPDCGPMPNDTICPGGCTPESDSDLCLYAGKNCGTLTIDDQCGASRTVECGMCTTGTCGGGGHPNICGSSPCTPESDSEFCNRNGRDCGTFSATDNCGASRTATCGGGCYPGETCGRFTPNVCGPTESVSDICLGRGANCGTITLFGSLSGPSRMHNLDCGTCVFAPNTCGGGGTPNVCGNTTCTGETMAELCELMGATGGIHLTADRCNQPRAIFCGELPDGLPEGSTMVCEDGIEANPDSTPSQCEDRGGVRLMTSVARYGFSSFTLRPTSLPPLPMFEASLSPVSWAGSGVTLRIPSRSSRGAALLPLEDFFHGTDGAGWYDGRRVAVGAVGRRYTPMGTDCAFEVTRCYGTAEVTFGP